MIIMGLDPGLATMGFGVINLERGVYTVIDYGIVSTRGVMRFTAVKLIGDEVYEYTPNQIKMAITGYGGADKKQMQLMVQSVLRLKSLPRPDDAADALAVALCHGQVGANKNNFRIK